MTVRQALWVTAIPPDHHGGGGHVRQAHLLAALCERVETDLVVAGRVTDDRVRGAVAGLHEVDCAVPPEPAGAWRRRARDLDYAVLKRVPFEVAQHAPVRVALAERLAALPAADLVQVEYVGLAPLLPAARTAHWALTLHNLPSRMAVHRGAIAPGARQRVMHGIEARNARRFEGKVACGYDTVVTVSTPDAAALPCPSMVVPNGVDPAQYPCTPLPTDPCVVFTGALYTEPNTDGLGWFLTDVWPRVRSAVPAATFSVVGLRPPASVQTACRAAPGVTLHADVDAVGPFLARARVAVVPLRIGSGTRLKALEAWAAGRPVVGTTIGLEGLAAVGGRDVLVADDSDAFARALVSVLTGDEPARRLAAAGHDIARSVYSWDVIGAAYADGLLERANASV